MDGIQNIYRTKTMAPVYERPKILFCVLTYGCDDAETCDEHTLTHTCARFLAMYSAMVRMLWNTCRPSLGSFSLIP